MERGFGFRELVEKRMRSLRPPPLLAPLERFLSSSSTGELCLSAVKGEETAVNYPSGPSVLDHFTSAIGVPPSGILLNESGFFGGLLVVTWTAEEDRLLVQLVDQHGVRRWSQIAKNLVGRIGKQCRERWHNHLRPDIKKETWTEEEERMLVEAHKKFGNKWAEIAKHVPGRSENSIKNHWNATKRRQNAKRRSKRKTGSRGGKPEPSILQDYIRSEFYEMGSNQDKYTGEPHLLREEHASPAHVFAAEGDEFFFKDQTSSSSKGDMDLMEMISWQMSQSQSRSQSSSCNGSF
uniref:Transcription factor MYB98-like n=1 Tax=Ananas comosus var. bracteatus TaxID=296719 RepID=A0A6V7NGH8_ANACO|nr:unnamed protein product [Ananas comosus var. bracteatus]